MRRRNSLLAAVALLAGSGYGLANEDSQSKGRRIDEVVTAYEKLGYLNGAVLVAEHGKVIYAKGAGNANMETHAPNTPQTKFGIASITKQFTAVLLLQQASEGKVRLDEKVSDHLPWYRKDTGTRMTLEQLLHHTSGLPADFDSPEFSDSAEASRHYEPEEFAQKFCQENLASQPGTKWEYSNCGYVLLGLVLERATGKPFADLLRERVLGPLEMNDSGMDSNNLAQLGGALGYKRRAGPRYVPGPYLDRTHIYAAGAMYSTLEDLFRWNQALSDGGQLPKEIREQVFRPGMHNWGYGWFVTKIPEGEPGAGSTMEEMRGDMPGNFFAWILRYPEQGDAIIVLRNGYGSTERLEQNLQAIVFNQKPKMPRRSAKDLAARAWQVPADWLEIHKIWSLIFVLAAAAGLAWRAVRRASRGAAGGG